MNYIVRCARDRGYPIQIVERIDTIAWIVFHTEPHVDNVEVLGKLGGPTTISVGIDTLDCGLAILPAKDKAGGIHFEHGDVHLSSPLVVCFDDLNIGELSLTVNKKSEGEFIFIYRG